MLERDTQKPYPISFGIQGAVNQKDGDSQQNRMQVQTQADDITKTGAHEAGHTAGLADPSASDKSKDKNGVPLGKGNLMNQGDEKGTKINGAQLRHMEKTIDDDKAKRNN